MDVEQREYERFSVLDHTFAALGNGFETVGKIVDISIKGLTLMYLSEGVKAGSDEDFSQVDIFLSEDRFHLPKMPCKIVYDIQDFKSDINTSIIKRRCGLHFGKLNKSQSELLELFLINYTISLPLTSRVE